MADGEERYVLTGGVLYLYVKQKGILWKFTGAKVS